MSKQVHVAVGVIVSPEQEILLARRAAHQHQGDRWEFPGGKVEAGESVQEALQRELAEELGLDSDADVYTSLMEQCHDYGDKQVRLDVWWVPCDKAAMPHAQGAEGQALSWVPVAELHNYDFPAANKPIVDKVQAAFI